MYLKLTFQCKFISISYRITDHATSWKARMSTMSSNGPNSPLSESQAHFRIARPTDSIPSLLPFYVDGLGFEVKGSFKDHEGFDGVLLALPPSSPQVPSLGYHLEFTQHVSHRAGRAPTQDNLVVFYMPDETLHQRAVARMKNAGFESVKSFNPYWDRHGTTFEDPDGYRVVLANTRSPV
ncbi:hypothetical protein EKO27_g11285 [Xylaria grammica]|uniref:VOC domain-containing protein n=1 Tax=Xylaria grammica TaxID=363999 RepID=A0A439CNZ6_9PEZI|nr:hypothetical protein EKO27_g11285 [Xylaria grammica]